MRIYIVINGPLYPESLGGSEIFAHALSTELRRRGHEVILIGNLADHPSDLPYEVVSLGPFSSISSRIRNLQRVRKILRRKGFTRKEGCVISVMAHSSLLGHEVMKITGSSVHALRFGGLDLDILTSPSMDLPYCLYSRLGLATLGRGSIYIVMSRSMLKKALKLGIPRERCVIIPNFIEQRFFNVNSEDSILKSYNVLFVGRLEKVKGIDLLLKGLKLVRREDPRVRLLIYGRGSMEVVLKHEFVDFRGPVPYEEVHEAYGRGAVFALPSRYEGFPNSLLQAMASGLPVVASKVGGVPEIVKDGYNGLLIYPDPEELSEAILYFLENREEAVQMGARARNSVHHLTPDKIIPMYEETLLTKI